jgi:hypothetical protein
VGIVGYIEPWDSLQSGRSTTRLAFARFSISTRNTRKWIVASGLAFFRSYPVIWRSKASTTTARSLSDTGKGKMPYTEATAGQTRIDYPATPSSHDTAAAPPSLLSGSSGRVSAATTGQLSQIGAPATACSGTSLTHINIREDFILICLKVKKFLTRRHDLGLSGITCDRELFQAFRNEYNSKFRRAYRKFSIRTAQRMSFVKVSD